MRRLVFALLVVSSLFGNDFTRVEIVIDSFVSHYFSGFTLPYAFSEALVKGEVNLAKEYVTWSIKHKINKGEIVITHNTSITNIKSLVANELYSYLKDTCDKDWGFRELIEQNTGKSDKNGIIIRVYMK